jgi:hypothetical protein
LASHHRRDHALARIRHIRDVESAIVLLRRSSNSQQRTGDFVRSGRQQFQSSDHIWITYGR